MVIRRIIRSDSVLMGLDLRAIESLEEDVILRLHRRGHHRLARSGRAVEEHATWRAHAERVKDLRVLDRQVDQLPQRLERLVTAAPIVKQSRCHG